MLCWGSWANTQKLSSQKWPFQLFYWDYSFGILLITLIFGLNLGSSGDVGRSFIDDLSQAELFYMRSASIGGVVFNFANLLLVIAIEISDKSIPN
jgi:glucose uptake protein